MEDKKIIEGKITEEILGEIFKEVEKDDINNNNNKFYNNITYINYLLKNKSKPELDFLFDYSKVLGLENNDPKLIHWTLNNLDKLYLYGFDLTLLENKIKESKEIYKINDYPYLIEKNKKNINSFKDNLPKNRNKEEIFIISKDRTRRNNNINENEFSQIQTKNILYESNSNEINEIHIEDLSSPISLIEKENKNKAENDYHIYEYDSFNSELTNKNEYLNISLEPGNYSEDEILNNIKRNIKRKIKAKEKKLKKIIDKNNDILSKKRKRSENNNISTFINNENCNDQKIRRKKIISELNEELSLEKIKNIFNELLSQYELDVNTDHEKECFIRKNLKIIEEIYKKNQKDFLEVLGEIFNIPVDKAKMLIEYEIFKTNLENKYCNFSKFLNKLYKLFRQYGIPEINSLQQLNGYIDCEPEIGKSLNHVIDNIVGYREKFNSYMGKHYNDINIINEELKYYFPNIKEKNNEYIIKLASKLNEYGEKFKVNIPKDLIISYIKDKKKDIDFSEDLYSNFNERKYSLESFINYNIGKETNVFNEENREIKDNFEENNVVIGISSSEYKSENDEIKEINEDKNIKDIKYNNGMLSSGQIFNINKNFMNNSREKMNKINNKTHSQFPFVKLIVSQIQITSNSFNQVCQTNNINLNDN